MFIAVSESNYYYFSYSWSHNGSNIISLSSNQFGYVSVPPNSNVEVQVFMYESIKTVNQRFCKVQPSGSDISLLCLSKSSTGPHTLKFHETPTHLASVAIINTNPNADVYLNLTQSNGHYCHKTSTYTYTMWYWYCKHTTIWSQTWPEVNGDKT